MTNVFADGVVEKITFPDGTQLFLSAGRLDFGAHAETIFLISPDVRVSGDIDAFCGFFADPLSAWATCGGASISLRMRSLPDRDVIAR